MQPSVGSDKMHMALHSAHQAVKLLINCHARRWYWSSCWPWASSHHSLYFLDCPGYIVHGLSSLCCHNHVVLDAHASKVLQKGQKL